MTGGAGPAPHGSRILDSARRTARRITAPLRIAAELFIRRRDLRYFLEGWPPGHFFSPIPSLERIRQRDREVFSIPADLPGVDLNADEQLGMVRALSRYHADHPYRDDGAATRFVPDNPNFGRGEAIILSSLLRHLKPARVIEVGCGYSSAVILDTRERFLGPEVECTFIEPYPQLLRSLMRAEDRTSTRTLALPLQEVDTSEFRRLRAGDVLFIDSTHVLKTDSDVAHALFRILPALAPGVMIHFHDIAYPFEYPRAWVYQGRAWNEAYALRAFLQYNSAFRIVLFNHWLLIAHARELQTHLPDCAFDPGAGLWLRRV